MYKPIKFLISTFSPPLAGFLSSIFISDPSRIYRNLKQPSFAPPNWIFGPVWTVLYILMGWASYRVWVSGRNKGDIHIAQFFYLIQLLLNLSWSFLFFRFGLRQIAFGELLILWFTILSTMLKFKKVDLAAFLLMIPYILWVSFAAILNYSVWKLNKGSSF